MPLIMEGDCFNMNTNITFMVPYDSSELKGSQRHLKCKSAVEVLQMKIHLNLNLQPIEIFKDNIQSV